MIKDEKSDLMIPQLQKDKYTNGLLIKDNQLYRESLKQHEHDSLKDYHQKAKCSKITFTF